MKKSGEPGKATKKRAVKKTAAKAPTAPKKRRASWEVAFERNLLAQGLTLEEARETVEDFALGR